MVETTPFGAGLTGRTVVTAQGDEFIPITDGLRIMFAYPGQDFYANIKVEVLPSNSYPSSKAALLRASDQMVAEGGTVANQALTHPLSGFEVHGLDRQKREGGVLGVYLLFDDPTHTATTIYFLNQKEPTQFPSMAEYATLRGSFLTRYTACVRHNEQTR